MFGDKLTDAKILVESLQERVQNPLDELEADGVIKKGGGFRIS